MPLKRRHRTWDKEVEERCFMDSSAYVSRMEMIDDPFSCDDLTIRAEVSINIHPTSQHVLLYSELYGTFYIGLFRIAGAYYKFNHSKWVVENHHDDCRVPSLDYDLINLLNEALKNYLRSRLNADLRDPNAADIPMAKIIKRTKLEGFVNLMKRIF